MNRILLPRVIGALIGFVAGSIGGAFLGLVVGGTFLGSLDIYESTGFEGYELAAYIGAIVGAIVMAIIGAEFARRIADKKGKRNDK